METMAIFLDGKECGRLSVQEQGLYLCCCAECRLPQETGPMRLYMLGERGEQSLGILQPEGGWFVLSRQISQREVRRTGRLLRGELRPVELREGEWHPELPEQLFREERLRCQLNAAGKILVCRQGRGHKVAVPFDEKTPFPLAELFCFARIRRIGEREYAIFAFDGENNPSFT